MVDPQNKELFEAELEIEELATQLADMLGVALFYAGVRKEKLKNAVEAYLDAIDEVFKDSAHVEYGFEEVIMVIEHLKKTRRELFG